MLLYLKIEKKQIGIQMKKILETKRLILRELNDDDFDSLKKVLSDPITMKFYLEPYDDNGVRKWIRWCKASYEKRGFGLWAVILKETGEMIGDCGVSMQTIDDELKPEIGYHLRRDYHRMGLGSEMTQAVKDYFFNNFDFDEVYSYMNKDNIASYKTAEKNGMTFLHIYKDSMGMEDRVYRITREEWNKNKSRKAQENKPFLLPFGVNYKIIDLRGGLHMDSFYVNLNILTEPGKLTIEEYEEMKKHAKLGGSVVREVLNGITDEEYLSFASDIATYHHEWWDGTGYSNGLTGEEIPLSARIMAIADVFDALISERCYKKPIPHLDAIEIIKEESGSHFDPKLVEVFLRHKEEFLNINKKN